MIRHFLVSVMLYFCIIATSLLILGVAKHWSGGTDVTTTGRDVAACKAFKFDSCE